MVDLLDGSLMMSLRIGYGMLYMTLSERYFGDPVHLVPGVGGFCVFHWLR